LEEAYDMRSQTTLFAIVFAIFVVVGATPSTTAAPSGDACSLLTQANVSAVLGVSVGPGSHVTPTFLTTCTWAQPGSPTIGNKNVVLSLKSADAFDMGRKLVKSPTTPVRGIGDDAYYTEYGKRPNLSVKKGNVAFNVAVYGDFPVDQVKAMEKTLALQILSKF
jgi:hypothetical protein